jgi:hypothetical protein
MTHTRKIQYIVLQNTQLTNYQEYVWCKDEKTANAVKARFDKERGSEGMYKWVRGAPDERNKAHWCVTGHHPYVIARADEVRRGQWYAGMFKTFKHAEEAWLSMCVGETDAGDYITGIGPLEGMDFVVVNAEDHAKPVPMWAYRHQLKAGECFEYLDEPGQPHLVVDKPSDADGVPGGWLVSTPATAKETGRWEWRVKVVPHWKNREPVILPCIDPLERMTTEGLTGLECLQRYEEAMQAEDQRISIVGGEQVVCLPPGAVGVIGGSVGGLSPKQLALAKEVWALKLKTLQATQRIADAEKARESAIACDDVDELPNMAYVKEPT